MSVLDFLDEELARLDEKHRRRSARVVSGAQGAHLELDGREVVSFSSNDYLGLAAHPALRGAVREAIDRHGVGAGASRLIVGNSEAHGELESAAATWLGTAAARLFNSGFSANTGLLPVLAGVEDEIFSDGLNHASLIDGSRLSRATIRVFRHRNYSDLARMVEASRARRRIIVTESVFSMDGDLADLPALRDIADRSGAILVVDEAHAAGVFGPAGRGLLAERGIVAEATMVTLGKALGAYGAVVAGGRSLAEVLWNRARSLVFTTGLPPAVAAASLAAVRIVQGAEGEARRSTLWSRVQQIAAGLASLELPVRATSPIIPLVVGDDREVMRWTARLLDRGVFVQGVRPPTVPEGTARLRIAVSAGHTEEDIGRLLDGIRAGLADGGRFVSRGTGAP